MADTKTAVAEAAEVIEIIFKGRRRAHYANPRELPVHEGDYVVVQAERAFLVRLAEPSGGRSEVGKGVRICLSR